MKKKNNGSEKAPPVLGPCPEQDQNRGASCGKLGNWMVNRLSGEELYNSVNDIGGNIFLNVFRYEISFLYRASRS